jgi:hypothetical protein
MSSGLNQWRAGLFSVLVDGATRSFRSVVLLLPPEHPSADAHPIKVLRILEIIDPNYFFGYAVPGA